jgi:DNA-directed RNA polymerase sigma subunit (sigma70/sigma32)
MKKEIENLLQPWMISKRPKNWKVDIKFVEELEKYIFAEIKKAKFNKAEELLNNGLLFLDWLSPREKKILYSRFVESKNLLEVAKGFDVTRERIRQIEGKALCRVEKKNEEIMNSVY